MALAAVAGLARRLWRYASPPQLVKAAPPPAVPIERLTPFQRAVVGDLQRQVRTGIRYQDGYYHGGDPPPDCGVCTDVVVRAFRAAGIDLHRAVAEDVRQHPSEYHITRPDPNIDHRRCRNLVVFFQRHGESLPVETADWQPGDLVFWDVGNTGRSDHVGIIANGRAAGGIPTVVHHWPGQPVAEADALHRFRIAYHFRWRGG